MVKGKQVDISFIFPVLNEEAFLGKALNAINIFSTVQFSYEIIVVDNGSCDRTLSIARSYTSLIFVQPELTIGGLRNFGARKASGKILVFLDGDICVTEEWWKSIGTVIERMEPGCRLITGSFCAVPKHSGWIEKVWFAKIVSKKNVNYINSGHLIVERSFFKSLGGFDEKLVTAEDYDFCQRALEVGSWLKNDVSLKVIHLGYPKDVLSFFRREVWHGGGDVATLEQLKKSKVACVSVALVLLAVTALVLAVFWKPVIIFFYVAGLFTICLLAAYRRCRSVSLDLALCAFLFAVYFLARGISVLVFFKSGTSFARSR
jgi:glycosyltransferase involved in cell wall biosynthesis